VRERAALLRTAGSVLRAADVPATPQVRRLLEEGAGERYSWETLTDQMRALRNAAGFEASMRVYLAMQFGPPGAGANEQAFMAEFMRALATVRNGVRRPQDGRRRGERAVPRRQVQRADVGGAAAGPRVLRLPGEHDERRRRRRVRVRGRLRVPRRLPELPRVRGRQREGERRERAVRAVRGGPLLARGRCRVRRVPCRRHEPARQPRARELLVRGRRRDRRDVRAPRGVHAGKHVCGTRVTAVPGGAGVERVQLQL
jgi:hypothetical protein